MNTVNSLFVRLAVCFVGMLCVSVAFAQVKQQGFVYEYNTSGSRKPLGNVEINVRYAAPQLSGDDGAFELNFPTRTAGDRVSVRRIDKPGYELFNRDAVEQWIISDRYPFTILMCRQDELKSLKDRYLSASSANYARQLEAERNKLDRLKSQGVIAQREYLRRLDSLQVVYDRQLDRLDVYVDRIARIDVSCLGEFDRQVIELLEQGHIDEAVRMYDDRDLAADLIKALGGIKTIDSAIDKLGQSRTAMANERDSLYRSLRTQLQTLVLAGGPANIGKASAIFDGVTTKDSTNVWWLIDYANFKIGMLADYKGARGILEHAVTEGRKQYGDSSNLVIQAVNNLGDLYAKTGNFDGAMECFEQVRAVESAVNGDSTKCMSAILGNIGGVYAERGEFRTAFEMFKQALEINQRLTGDNSEDIALLYNNMGGMLREIGEFDQALEYYNLSLDLRRRIYGDSHTIVSTTLNNLAGVHFDLGHYDESLDLWTEALSIRTAHYGEVHPQVAMMHNNIGMICRKRGDYAQARKYYDMALSVNEQFFGPIHPSVGFTSINLGVIAHVEEDYEAAKQYNNKALAALTPIFGEKHPAVATVWSNLSCIYEDESDFAHALECIDKALGIQIKI